VVYVGLVSAFSEGREGGKAKEGIGEQEGKTTVGMYIKKKKKQLKVRE
jgi:hypothetical protein